MRAGNQSSSACMVTIEVMGQAESPSQRIARQMAELMERHHVKNAPQLERMFLDGGEEPVSYITINRILKAEARTRPNPDTLQRVARLLGETLAQAFPEPDEERAPVVTIGGRRIALKALDGPPLTQREADQLVQGSVHLDDEEGEKGGALAKPTRPPRPEIPRRRPSR